MYQSNCHSFPLSDLEANISAHNFNIFSANVRSLTASYDGLCNLLAGLPPAYFDILGLQEVWSVNPGLIIPGYQTILFNTRDKGLSKNSHCGGGVAFFVRNELNFEIMSEQSVFKKGLYESIWIRISLPKKKFLIIGNIYRPNSPPLGNVNKAIEIHEGILNSIKKDKAFRKDKLFLVSDFNLDLAAITSNKNVNYYMDLHHSLGLVSLINISAHITKTSSKVIDHIFTKMPSSNLKSGVIETDLSDHMPTFVSDGSIFTNQQYPPTPKPLINSVTTSCYLNLLSKLEFSQSNDPEIAFNSFFSLITEAANLAFPLKTPSNKKNKNRSHPWMSPGLIKSSKVKHKLYSKKLKFPSIENINIFKKYSYVLNKCMRSAKKTFYSNSFEQAKNNNKETWRLIGEVAGRVKKNNENITKTFEIDGNFTNDPVQIAEGFNNFFGKIGPELANQIPSDPNPNSSFKDYLGNPVESEFSLRNITTEILLRHIGNLTPKSSYGSDLISNKLLKQAVTFLHKPLLRLFNLSFETGYVPEQITLSKVIPLFKEGTKTSFTNYRPIAITSSIGKLMERVVKEQLCNYLESNSILSNDQYGFRANHSVCHPLMHFSKNIFDSLSKGMLNLCVYIDLKKAFDTVDISILLSKLSHYGIRGKEFRWFQNYLRRSQHVFTGCTLSEIIKMICGIPQGTVLGPILFILFINDLPLALALLCQLFADDCTLQVEGANIDELISKASLELARAEKWFMLNKLTLNLKKTKFCVYSNNLSSVKTIPDLMISNNIIERIGHQQTEKSVRFLGLWVGDTGLFDQHITKLKSKLNSGLFSLATSKENAPLNVQMSIYRALFESHLRFANVVFGSAPQQKIHELFILQKKAIRHVANTFYLAHTDPLFQSLKLLKIEDLISHSRASFVHKWRLGYLPRSFHRTFFSFINSDDFGRRDDPLTLSTPSDLPKNLSRSPYLMTCQAWNAVPYEIKIIQKHSEFKKSLSEHFFSKYNKICTIDHCRACIHSY